MPAEKVMLMYGSAGRKGGTMIKVTLKDDDGRVIQSMECPVGVMAVQPTKEKHQKKNITLFGVFGTIIKNLIVNNVKEKYFGGLL